MRTSKLVWFRTSLRLALLAITLGLAVISSETVARAQQQRGQEPADAQTTPDVEDSEQLEPQHVTGNCFAVVSSSGFRLSTNCVVSTRRLGIGQYEVIFDRIVRHSCVYLCTIGLLAAPSGPPGGECGVSWRGGTSNGVFVATRNSGGSPADRGFHLGIFCR